MTAASPALQAESVAAGVRRIISEVCRDKAIRDRDHLANDLKLDSLSRTELMMAIELRFGFDFSEAEILHASTVSALITLVEQKVSA